MSLNKISGSIEARLVKSLTSDKSNDKLSPIFNLSFSSLSDSSSLRFILFNSAI